MRFLLIYFLNLTCFLIFINPHLQSGNYSGGSGTLNDPYIIATLADLEELCQATEDWDAHFIQTTDIDATSTSGWNGGAGFSPIGNSSNKFTGSYDGQNHTIDGLTVNRTEPDDDEAGFFGRFDATVKNLGLTNVDINGYQRAAALVSNADGSCDIINCYSTGDVTGGNNVGGLVGNVYSGNQILNSYSHCDVYASSGHAGGLVGYFHGSSLNTVDECYSTGTVYRTDGAETSYGAFCAEANGGNILDSYCTGSVIYNNGDNPIDKGFVGQSGTVTYDGNFFDSDVSNQSSAAGATAITTAEMQRASTFLDAGWHFWLSSDGWAMNQDENNGYPFLRMEDKTPGHVWLGNDKSTDWTAGGNWSEESMPGATNNVIIADYGAVPVIENNPSSPAVCNKMTIEPNAPLTISSGKALTVNGNLVVDGSLLIESDGTGGTGSLIVNGSASGQISVERYATATKWHYVSSPVDGVSLDDPWMSANDILQVSGQDHFYRWDEDTDYWIYYNYTGSEPEDFGDTEFVDARGYTLRKNTDGDLSFSGTPITSNVNYSASYTSDKGIGFHLVGNPYTSALGITSAASGSENFLAKNTALLDDNYEAIFVWAEGSSYNYGDNDYKVISNGSIGSYTQILQDYVQPGQAFMVKVASAGTIQFTENMQAHAGVDFYKEKETWPSFELAVTGNDYSNVMAIGFHEGMSKGLDPSYDVAKMKGNPDLSIYSKLVEDNGRDFIIQALPNFEADYSIPVGIDVTEEGTYKFEAVTMEQIPGDVHVYLEDLQTGNVLDLKETSTYTCLLEASGSISDRFVLHFTLTPYGEEELQADKDPVQIWTNNKTVNLYNPGQLKGTIKIFNLYGQQIMQSKLNGTQQQQLEMQVPAAYYLVSVISEKDMISKKVFVK